MAPEDGICRVGEFATGPPGLCSHHVEGLSLVHGVTLHEDALGPLRDRTFGRTSETGGIMPVSEEPISFAVRGEHQNGVVRLFASGELHISTAPLLEEWLAAVEHVLVQNDRFAVSETLPGAGERMARATDPRA